jgi:hypothetical protein
LFFADQESLAEIERSIIAHKGKAVVTPSKQLLMYIVR